MGSAATSVADDEEDAMSTTTTTPTPTTPTPTTPTAATPTTVTLSRKVLGAVLLAAAVLGGGIAAARSAGPGGVPAGASGPSAAAPALPDGADLASGEAGWTGEDGVVLDGAMDASADGFTGDPATDASPSDGAFELGTDPMDELGGSSGDGFGYGASEDLPGGSWEPEEDRSAPPLDDSPAADPAPDGGAEDDPVGAEVPRDDTPDAVPASDPTPGGVAPVLPSRTIERQVAVGQRVELFADASLAAGWHDPDGSADWLCLEFRPERRDFWLDGADCTGAGLWTRIQVPGTYVVRIRAVEVRADAPSEAGLRSEGEIVLRLVAG